MPAGKTNPNMPDMDSDLFPTLSIEGKRILDFMREHPAAPIFRNRSGNKLSSSEVDELMNYEREISSSAVGWPQDGKPVWLPEFVERTLGDVPYYRQPGKPMGSFEEIPTVCRADFSSDIARFVPDSIAIDRLINYRTTGTTGSPLLIASHPLVAGRYLSYHKSALRHFGIELTYGQGKVGVILLGFQQKCFTYVSVTPTMNDSGLAKINLHPNDWRNPDDRAKYLDAMAAEVIAGDPLSFSELLQLPTTIKPRALLSVAMMLTPGLRKALETRFKCPVLDIYSLNEVGPVAVFDPALNGHRLLQPRLYVEILDREGRNVMPGERGEITLTGGFNFCLPLLRYRTGDFAEISYSHATPVLIGLSGRTPVRFRNELKQWFNNIDITHALGQLPLPQFGLHQRSDGTLILRLTQSALSLAEHAKNALKPIFGQQHIAVETISSDNKIVQYSSDMEDAII